MAVRDKGDIQMSMLRVLLRPRGQSWAATGPVSNHGRQRPLTTCIDKVYLLIRTIIVAYVPWLLLPPGEGGPMTMEDVNSRYWYEPWAEYVR